MKRLSVIAQSLVMLLVLFCLCSSIHTSLAWSADATVEATTVKDSKEAPPPAPECKARLEALKPDYEFGSIRSGDVKAISHTFVFRNSGEETLVISKVKPSCGCTSAIASATQVAPGATATLTATLNPKGKSGKQTITVRVTSNDPTNTVQVFKMVGTILSPWRIFPVQLDLGALGKLQSATKDAIVTSQYLIDEPHFKITGLKASSPEIRAVTAGAPPTKADSANNSYVEVQRIVRVNVTAGQTEGQQTQRVYVSTDDPKNPTHTLTVRWNVEGDISRRPEKVFVSNIKGKKNNRDLTLSSRSGTAFEVTSIEVQGSKGNDDLEIILKPDSTPTRKVYTISTKIISDAPTDTRSGKILFKTNSPDQPEIVVSYVATLRK